MDILQKWQEIFQYKREKDSNTKAVSVINGFDTDLNCNSNLIEFQFWSSFDKMCKRGDRKMFRENNITSIA